MILLRGRRPSPLRNFKVSSYSPINPNPTATKYHHPDIDIAEVRPQQGGQDECKQNQQPAHGRRSRFAQVVFRSVVPDFFSYFQFLQKPDHGWSDQQTQNQRGNPGPRRAERDVPEHVQERIVRAEWIKKVIKHRFLCCCYIKPSKTVSICDPRDPLNNRQSSDWVVAFRNSAAA